MTVKVLGNWERAWTAPMNEWDLWIHPLREWNLENLIMVPTTGLDKERLTEYSDVSAALAAETELTHVYIDENATDNLADFTHPTDALYIVGKTGFAPYNTNFRSGVDKAVKIISSNVDILDNALPLANICNHGRYPLDPLVGRCSLFYRNDECS